MRNANDPFATAARVSGFFVSGKGRARFANNFLWNDAALTLRSYLGGDDES